MMEFVHPGEQTAWNALLDNKIFQTLVGVFQSIYTDLTTFGALKGRSFLVTENTLPDIYGLYAQAGDRLGLGKLPPLYAEMEYGIQIKTVGTDGDCAVVINSSCLEECSDEQLLALFGQELAHVRYRHLRVLNMDSLLDVLLAKVPMVGPAAAQTVKTLLLQWKEYACYTADRGAAIAAGDKLPVYQNLTMAMGRKLDEQGVRSILEENDSRKPALPGQNTSAKVVMQMMLGSIAVPFGIWRIRELEGWDGDLEEVSRNLEQMESYTTFAQKTVNAIDYAAKGVYTGTVKTAEAVKQGSIELGNYIEENKPIWEENLNTAKEKAVDAVKQSSAELGNYIEENKPIWEENLNTAKIRTVEAIQKGKADLDSYVEANKPQWEENMAQAKQKAGQAVTAGASKMKDLLKKARKNHP